VYAVAVLLHTKRITHKYTHTEAHGRRSSRKHVAIAACRTRNTIYKICIGPRI